MMKKEESLADIIAEMRRWIRQEGNRATWDWRPGNGWSEAAMRAHLENAAEEWKLLLDRLEAAEKREHGNESAMRDALLKCSEIAIQCEVDEMSGVAGTTDMPEARSASEAITAILMEINAALSAPPRNCDIGSANEQEKRFDVWVRDRRGDLDCTGKCPAHNGVDFGVVNCVLQWAQMPYEAMEGGAE